MGDVEVMLAQIWKDLLRLPRVSRDDHFFELGGHSFMVIALIERLREHGFNADVRTVFDTPILSALAAALTTCEPAGEAFVAPPSLIPKEFARPLETSLSEDFRL